MIALSGSTASQTQQQRQQKRFCSIWPGNVARCPLIDPTLTTTPQDSLSSSTDRHASTCSGVVVRVGSTSGHRATLRQASQHDTYQLARARSQRLFTVFTVFKGLLSVFTSDTHCIPHPRFHVYTPDFIHIDMKSKTMTVSFLLLVVGSRARHTLGMGQVRY